MNIENPSDLYSVNLSLLTYESQNLLSLLLNTKKVFPSDTPEKLPRDWRGLASLLNISAEVANNINECQDKTGKVLEIWLRRDKTATVGQLVSYLKKIDRYDICDDLLEYASKGQLFSKQLNQVVVQNNQLPLPVNNGLITYHDVQCGAPQMYDAYVLYAIEDKEFGEELLSRMKAKDFKLCTLDDLLPGHTTQYGPVSQLISERCNRIILVYSPDFLNSSANTFYMDYAQAVAIESKQLKILPLIYRKCELPRQHRHYYALYYTPPGERAAYDFWEKLEQSLLYSRMEHKRIANSTIKITEITSDISDNKSTAFLALPDIPTRSISMNGLSSLNTTTESLGDTMSLKDGCKTCKGKSKKGSLSISNIFSKLKVKKKKKEKVLLSN